MVTSATVQRAEKELKLQIQKDKPVCLYYCAVLATVSGRHPERTARPLVCMGTRRIRGPCGT